MSRSLRPKPKIIARPINVSVGQAAKGEPPVKSKKAKYWRTLDLLGHTSNDLMPAEPRGRYSNITKAPSRKHLYGHAT